MSNLEFKDEELARIEDRWKVSFYITHHFYIQWSMFIKTLIFEKLGFLIGRLFNCCKSSGVDIGPNIYSFFTRQSQELYQTWLN